MAPALPSPPTDLGKLVAAATARFETAVDWDHFITLSRAGSDLHPATAHLPHPAGHLLHHL